MSTVILSHPACQAHNMGPGQPECPERTLVIQDELIRQGLADFLAFLEAPAAGRAELERVHSRGHVESIFTRAPRDGLVQIDPDTFMNAGTLEAALRAAGAVVHATDLVLEGKVGNAFCNVRPPGHHAERDAAMGFCFFNNVAVGVAHALAGGLARIAVLDFDVHHGNGTEDIFRDDQRVMLCSSYQHPLYPYSGGRDDSGPSHQHASGGGVRERCLSRRRGHVLAAGAGTVPAGDDFRLGWVRRPCC